MGSHQTLAQQQLAAETLELDPDDWTHDPPPASRADRRAGLRPAQSHLRRARRPR
jgi:hypothetical protein